MCDSIDMNVGVFWETSVGFLKSVLSKKFCCFSQNIDNVLSIWMWKIGQHSTAFKK